VPVLLVLRETMSASAIQYREIPIIRSNGRFQLSVWPIHQVLSLITRPEKTQSHISRGQGSIVVQHILRRTLRSDTTIYAKTKLLYGTTVRGDIIAHLVFQALAVRFARLHLQ